MVTQDQDWRDHAVCAQASHDIADLFFPSDGEKLGERLFRERVAKEVCMSCPVRMSCLEAAFIFDEQGIWGGTTWEERKRMRAQRGIPRPPTGPSWLDCGTERGYTRHRRAGEEPCRACRDASTLASGQRKERKGGGA